MAPVLPVRSPYRDQAWGDCTRGLPVNVGSSKQRSFPVRFSAAVLSQASETCSFCPKQKHPHSLTKQGINHSWSRWDNYNHPGGEVTPHPGVEGLREGETVRPLRRRATRQCPSLCWWEKDAWHETCPLHRSSPRCRVVAWRLSVAQQISRTWSFGATEARKIATPHFPS